MGKPVKIKFKNKVTGKTEIVTCHDPDTCREHTWISRAYGGSETKTFADFHGQATYEDDDNVTFDTYNKDSIVKELYDDRTLEIRTNDSFVSVNPYGYAPKDSEVLCEDCGEVLEYRVMKWDNEQYDGREYVWVHKDKPEFNFFSNHSLNKNLHIEGEGAYGDQPTRPAHHSKTPSWCTKCGTLGSIEVDRDAWADNISCNNPECDYTQRYSLGD